MIAACGLAAPVAAQGSTDTARPNRNWGVTGAVGFPNFFSGQLSRKVTEKLALGVSAGYSFVPEITQDCGAKVKMSGSNIEFVTRYHFTGSSFFGGVNFGYQDFYVKAVQTTIPGAEYDIKKGARVYYATPNIGWFKVYDSGITLGFEIGVRVPVSKSGYGDHTGPGDLTPDVKDKMDNGINLLAEKPVPYLTLLRLGYSF